MKKLFILLPALIAMNPLYATDVANALSLPGYFGNINNNTNYVIECSQVIGGYCANNPMPANGYIQMLPDPGSNIMRGHIMIYQKTIPGKYLDNISFIYKKQNNDQWVFTTVDNYQQVNIKMIMPDTIVINAKG